MPIIIEFDDNYSINEADAEVSVLAEANTTPLSEAVCNVQDVSPDEAQPSSGEVGEAPDAGLSLIFIFFDPVAWLQF